MRGRIFFFMDKSADAFLYLDFAKDETPVVPPLNAKVVVEDKAYSVVDIVYWYGRNNVDIGVFVKNVDEKAEEEVVNE